MFSKFALAFGFVSALAGSVLAAPLSTLGKYFLLLSYSSIPYTYTVTQTAAQSTPLTTGVDSLPSADLTTFTDPITFVV